MSKLLIIGGTGFVGKSILDYLVNNNGFENSNISSVDVASRRASEMRAKNPELISKKVQLHDLDITSCRYLPDADLVIHAVANTDARLYMDYPEDMMTLLRDGVDNFCEIAKKQLKNKKILYLSSGAVYGQVPGDIVAVTEDYPFLDLETLPQNKRLYAEGKRYGENKIKELHRRYGHAVTIARCFSFFGKYLPLEQHFAIGNFIANGFKNEKIVIKSDRLVIRSYMSADDMSQWLIKLCQIANKNAAEIFNVGSDMAISIQELGSLISKKFYVDLKANQITNHYVDRYIPDISKANKIGLKITKDIHQILNEI